MTTAANQRPEVGATLEAGAWYADNHAYLADELRKLDAVLRLRVAAFRREGAGAEASQHGLFITHDEVDGLLDEQGSGAGGDTREARWHVDRLQRQIAAKAGESLRRGVFLGLPRLAHLFGLSPFEAEAVLICLAPELRRRYDRVYAYLQDDVTRKRPSVDLVLDLLGRDETERWRARALFGAQAPLVHAGLLQPVDDPHSPSGSSGLAQFLRLDARILHYLLGHSTLDGRLDGLMDVEPATEGAEPVVDVPAAGAALLDFVRRDAGEDEAPGERLVAHFCGPDGVGKRALARAVAGVLGRPLLRLDAEGLKREGEARLLLRLAFRESLLWQAPLYIASADVFLEDEALRATLAREAGAYGWCTLLGGERPWPYPPEERARYYAVELPVPDVAEREAVWQRALKAHLPVEASPRAADTHAADTWAARLAERFRLTPGQIREAAASLGHRRAVQGDAGPVRFEDLAAACRDGARHHLGTLAAKVRPRYGWGDLVLPDNQRAQLRELCDQVRYQRRVFDQWGFGERIKYGKGLSALFAGPPGTGKTMAAEVVARELHLDLYRIDLASVVSKYIGETEKNLERVFAEAERTNAVLFFDEADALFGKRTEVSDAHDRYANIETSYLLQRMEAYDGVVILASNLRENMDDAFLRRLRFLVEFPFPDATGREEIWRAHLPDTAPVSDAVDVGLLSERLPVAGGTIKNIALNAAFLAAADGGVIGVEHLRRGARREYEKIGKLWDESILQP